MGLLSIENIHSRSVNICTYIFCVWECILWWIKKNRCSIDWGIFSDFMWFNNTACNGGLKFTANKKCLEWNISKVLSDFHHSFVIWEIRRIQQQQQKPHLISASTHAKYMKQYSLQKFWYSKILISNFHRHFQLLPLLVNSKNVKPRRRPFLEPVSSTQHPLLDQIALADSSWEAPNKILPAAYHGDLGSGKSIRVDAHTQALAQALAQAHIHSQQPITPREQY